MARFDGRSGGCAGHARAGAAATAAKKKKEEAKAVARKFGGGKKKKKGASCGSCLHVRHPPSAVRDHDFFDRQRKPTVVGHRCEC